MSQEDRPLVMIVDDNENDLLLAKRAFADVDVDVTTLKDGSDAIESLRESAAISSTRTPDLILLDLNMGRVDGRQALQLIKSDDALKTLPIIVLTTSNSNFDVRECYLAGANCFVTKPVSFVDFEDTVRAIAAFWFGTVTLPT